MGDYMVNIPMILKTHIKKFQTYSTASRGNHRVRDKLIIFVR